MSYVGQPINRVDGILKVTGRAKYSAEHALPRSTHAVLVLSTIPSGVISSYDTHAAEKMPGVLLIMTHKNAMRLPQGGKAAAGAPPAGRVLNLLQDDQVHYNNQPIAVVVAETLEQARNAASSMKVSYRKQHAVLDFAGAKHKTFNPGKANDQESDTNRGDLRAGIRAASTQVIETYTTPIEHHNPMEPHATVASWNGDHLEVYDSTQYITGVRKTVSKTLGIPADNVRVICPYVGGGFGCKGSTWSHVVLAAMASKQVGRPVKLVLDRPQMFGMVGNRPQTEQHLTLGAQRDGKLVSMQHDVVSTTSMMEVWLEPSALVTRMLYDCANQKTSHRLTRINLGTPTFMRAPGESSGSFALESAMDELAVRLNMDPIALRLKNYAEQDPDKKKPWSSKSLRECYRVGAERFDWSRRISAPGSMRAGSDLVGLGMATATYPARRSPANANAKYLPDGTAVVTSGSHDLGTGTYTIMTQVAADALGLPPSKIRFELGDSSLPEAPVSGGSQTTASVAPAVQEAATAARQKLIDIARKDSASVVFDVATDDIRVEDGWIIRNSNTARREPLAAVIARNGGQPVEASAKAEQGPEKNQYSMHSFGAVFAEVHVDPDLGTVRVARIVASYGVGQLLNKKTAHSQLMGGIVWGIGMALLEKTEIDPRTGRAVNANLAEYHVPVNADINAIEVIVVDEHDEHINALGAKGIGEIGITGVGAAIANAVYHATGKRVRDLPITLDKLIT
jgi:xanthine dehydrogenase YagR molybdenum-binding subunit